ncbi:hypothetical protein OPQ81_008527 [Rhizoctonia solani]|nr:hypothetical protein OPQ81_008527 [Rhizoctonia solani]
MNFSTLSRPSMLFQRALAPNALPLARYKSTGSKSSLFSPMPRKLEVAVTPKRVRLTLAESMDAPVAPKAAKATSTTKDLKASVEDKVKKALDAIGTKVTKATTTKADAPLKKAKTTEGTTTPKATKPSKNKSSTESTETAPCWVDASPTHIAIVIGDQYKVFGLNDGWMNKHRDVNWAETAAFELLAQILAERGRTGVVHVNSDSFTALRAMSGEKIRVPEIMESARRTGDILKTSMFSIKGVKVSRTTNLADKFTRGKTVDGYEEMKGDITVPKALVPYVTVA